MTINDVMLELEKNGSDQTKKTLLKHGAKEPFFGVKAEFLKKLQKKIKINHKLALELYDTGNSDAMYFAAMIVDPAKMNNKLLQSWVKSAYWYYLSEHAVPSVAAKYKDGFSLALKWIDKKEENYTSAGWATLSIILSKTPNSELDIMLIQKLLSRVDSEIHKAKNRTRYTMNNFVIAVGSYIPDLTNEAIKIAENIGKVTVYMGETSCKVPFAPDYINKIVNMDRVGKKRK